MFPRPSRREFVAQGLTAGALVGLGDFAFLGGLPPVSADEARLKRDKVRFSADMEPLVRLIEETPRSRLLEAVAEQMHAGVGYQQWLTALFLAGVRGIQPRPVGFKFHAVLVVNSAHLASQAMPDNERWLPLFWALDNYKSSQKRNEQEGNWSMAAVQESKLPSSTQAKASFIEAMDNWDEEGTDRAIVALARSAGAGEIIELFWRYGARDFRDIGHKAIYAANSWRALQAIGWRHAEPVLRSLAYALLEHREKGNPAQLDLEPDRPWRENIRKVAQIRPDWQQGTWWGAASAEFLECLRRATYSDACDQIVRLLNNGTSPACVWDALFLRGGELLMQNPGIVGIHCVTSVNALHFAFTASANDETRRMLMLQAAAFLVLFRNNMGNSLRTERDLLTLEPLTPQGKGATAVEEILADVSKDRLMAARKTLALAEAGEVAPLMTAARRLIFSKGSDSHDYKFSSAALEDYYHTTAAYRARYLATSMFNLRGLGDKDNNLIERTRAVLARA
jgi:hypothetical protein